MESVIVTATIILTFVVTIGGLFYKSKCTNVNVLWGCFSFAQNVDDETKIDMQDASNPKC